MLQSNLEQKIETTLLLTRSLIESCNELLNECGFGIFESKKLELNVGLKMCESALETMSHIIEKCFQQSEKPKSCCM